MCYVPGTAPKPGFGAWKQLLGLAARADGQQRAPFWSRSITSQQPPTANKMFHILEHAASSSSSSYSLSPPGCCCPKSPCTGFSALPAMGPLLPTLRVGLAHALLPFSPPFFWLTAARYEPYVSCGWKAELITHRDRAARSASLCKTRSHLLPGIRQHRGFFPRKVGASKAARWPCWHGRQHPPATREMLWVAKQHLGNKIQGQWVREGKDGPLSAPSAGWEPVHSARFGSGVVAGSK